MSETVQVGKIEQLTETERREEIDYRVNVLLAQREYFKREYSRGFCDCLYIVVFVAWAIYLYFWKAEE